MSVNTDHIGQQVRALPDGELCYRAVAGTLIGIVGDVAAVEYTTTTISRHGLAKDGGTFVIRVPRCELETQAEFDARCAALPAVPNDGFPEGF